MTIRFIDLGQTFNHRSVPLTVTMSVWHDAEVITPFGQRLIGLATASGLGYLEDH